MKQELEKQSYFYVINAITIDMASDSHTRLTDNSGLQTYGGPESLSHDFKIWPITFQGSGPSGPILFRCEKISFY